MLPSRPGERGLGLLECAMGMALAGIVLATTVRVSMASAHLVRRTRAAAETLDLARNLLEHELGAPCAPAFECPAAYRCTVERTPLTAIADRVVATVARVDGEAAEALRTLAPAPSCGS